MQSKTILHNRLEGSSAMQEEFILCPVCGHKTRDKIREDTRLEKFPLFFPKCKQEIVVNVEKFKVIVIDEPAAKPQSL